MNNNPQNKSRREALKQLSLITGLTLSSGATLSFLSGCQADDSTSWEAKSLTADQLDLLKAACDRILPKTNTPGALDALVHRYIDETITFIYKPDAKENFLSGLDHIDQVSRLKYKKKFTEINKENQDDILRVLAEEWKSYKGDKTHIFKELRDLTIAGFASSEIGAKQFFIHDPIPGPYQGCIPYEHVNGTYAL